MAPHAMTISIRFEAAVLTPDCRVQASRPAHRNSRQTCRVPAALEIMACSASAR